MKFVSKVLLILLPKETPLYRSPAIMPSLSASRRFKGRYAGKTTKFLSSELLLYGKFLDKLQISDKIIYGAVSFAFVIRQSEKQSYFDPLFKAHAIKFQY